MHALPEVYGEPVTHNISAHGHIRVQIADVVHERAARDSRNKRARNSRDWRVRHRQNNISTNPNCARYGEKEIAKIIADALQHLEAGEGRGADTLGRNISMRFAPK